MDAAGIGAGSLVPPAAPGSRQRLAFLLGCLLVLVAAANVGTILSPSLARNHPAVLLALSSRNRHLLLVVAAGISPLAYGMVGLLRLLAPVAPLYLLGLGYGDSGLRWLERQAGGTPASIRWVEKGFDKASVPVVFLMPGSNLVCLLAGARRMPWRRFAIALVTGILARLVFFWFLGKALQDPLDAVLSFMQRYQWWLGGAFFVLTMAQSWRRMGAVAKEAAHEAALAHDAPAPAPAADAEPTSATDE
jgi:membrane protein DedA with SNARE-associated domain